MNSVQGREKGTGPKLLGKRRTHGMFEVLRKTHYAGGT